MNATGWSQTLDARLAAVVAGDDTLSRAQSHLVTAPAAKRIRPRATALFAELIGRNSDARLVDDAAAIELVHTASLLHDDVVDHARTRRGRPSANALFSDGVAVLAGDALLSRALRLMTPALVPFALHTVEQMSRAALLEVQLRGRADARAIDCMAIVDGKSAALFALCGRAAAVDPADADAERLARAGLALGRMFQLRDDVDDLIAVDRERGNDVREQTPTLPLALLSTLDAALAARLAALWAGAETDPMALVEAIARSAAPQRALEAIAGERAALANALAPYARRPACATLLALADGLVTLPADHAPSGQARGAA